MNTFTNARTNETVSTNHTRTELAQKFAEVAPADHWLYFWMTKAVQDAPKSNAIKNMTVFLGDLFLYAIGRELKRPMIRAQYRNRRFKIYLSTRGTLCLKSGAVAEGTSDPIGDEEYVGCFTSGKFLPPSRPNRTPLATEQEFIDRLTAQPVEFLAECSKDMGRCCYCNKPLSDSRSKQVGYGPTCASKWGLPWGENEFKENVPSFAQLWAVAREGRENIRTMMDAIRAQPLNTLTWLVLNDALQEAGWSHERVTVPPTKAFVVPRS